MDSNFIRIKDRGIVIGVAAMALATCFFVYRSARDRNELDRAREQNRLLGKEIRRLEDAFATIRKYTKSADALAKGVGKPQERLTDDMFEMPDNRETGALFAHRLFAAAPSPIAKASAGRSDLERFTKMLASLDTMSRDANLLVGRLKSLATILKYDKKFVRAIPSTVPVEDSWVTSEFGSRLSPFEGKRHFHAGVDLAAAEGTEVRAPADGIITFAGDFDTLGKALVVNHDNGIMTRYGHLRRYLVKSGMPVKRGQTIAIVGNTGRSTGPHLHYEVWVRNVAVNPRDFFYDMSEHGGDGLIATDSQKPAGMPALAGIGGEE